VEQETTGADQTAAPRRPSEALEDTMQASAATGDPAPAADVLPPRTPGRRGKGKRRSDVPMVAVPPDGLGWSQADLEELDRTAPGLLPGRIVRCDQSGALVLMPWGAARATFCAALLLAAARAKASGRIWPRPGDRVALRRWPDGPITVEGVVV
jgi:hypothetical protein